jgi:Ca-activated chloride channel family protein
MKNRDQNEMPEVADDPRVTAYALGELDERERAEVEAMLAASPRGASDVAAIRALASTLEDALESERGDGLRADQRASIIESAGGREVGRRTTRRWAASLALWGSGAAAAGILGVVAVHLFGEEAEVAPFTYDILGEPAAVPRPLRSEALQALEGLGYIDDDAGRSNVVVNKLAPTSHLGGVSVIDRNGFGAGTGSPSHDPLAPIRIAGEAPSTEDYAHLTDNPFVTVAEAPLSTFSISPDTASYANVRRFLLGDELPPPDAVRIEELVNYFRYDDPPPTGDDPFSIQLEVASAPWRPEHRLVRIGLRGREVAFADRRPTNLVFLLDVSGSMSGSLELPLVKQGMRLLVDQLDERDSVAIVVYAGAAGVVLPSTSCADRPAVLGALEQLSAGGSTNGGQGIRLAYRTARDAFRADGINRVILCTDGDFNVGTTSEGQLARLVESEAKSGVYLTVLGFGGGNLKDSALSKLAQKSNGNYAYIDSLREARRVLVEQMGGTLETIAKDVKIQVEFNPLEVAAYRLIGYETRLLAAQDFNNDQVDAGEIGAGHTVTALYEVVPAGAETDVAGVDPLKYQAPTGPSIAAGQGELLTVKLRYKDPEESTSRLIEAPLIDRRASFDEASTDLRFAAAVAAFGMLLRGSEHVGTASFQGVLRWAIESQGTDRGGYRAELLELVSRTLRLSERR